MAWRLFRLEILGRSLGIATSEAARERRRDGLGRCGILTEELKELLAIEPEDLPRGLRADRRRSRLVDEERELAEVMAGADRVDAVLAAPIAREDTERPAHDDVQAVGGIALIADDVAGRECHRDHVPRQSRQRDAIEPREQINGAETLAALFVVRPHRRAG